MGNKYLCYDCQKLLHVTGFEAVNEIGRKWCEGCGDNKDNLVVVDTTECDRAIKKQKL